MINNFDSIDKLMELGLGLAVAQQMMRTMNTTMAETCVPTVQNPSLTTFQNPANSAGKFFVCVNNAVAGPLTNDELSLLIREKKVTPDTLMWMPGMNGWSRASNIPLVNKYLLLG